MAINSLVAARAAISGDTPEILRLVKQVYWDMHAVYGGLAPVTDTNWEDRVAASLERRFDKDAAAFVLDGEGGKLAAVAAGRISETLPSPRRNEVLEGHIEWVGTDPQYRGHGYATAVTERLLNWFRDNRAMSVSLHASSAAESLYVRMGFGDGGPRALSIRLTDI